MQEDGEKIFGFTLNLKALPQRSFTYKKDRWEQYTEGELQETFEQFERDLAQ